MSEVTAMDMELARQLLSTPPGYRGKSHVERIAAALADEREQARAPFLALADELEADGKGDSGYMEYHEGFNAALITAAKSIRAAALDPT